MAQPMKPHYLLQPPCSCSTPLFMNRRSKLHQQPSVTTAPRTPASLRCRELQARDSSQGLHQHQPPLANKNVFLVMICFGFLSTLFGFLVLVFGQVLRTCRLPIRSLTPLVFVVKFRDTSSNYFRRVRSRRHWLFLRYRSSVHNQQSNPQLGAPWTPPPVDTGTS